MDKKKASLITAISILSIILFFLISIGLVLLFYYYKNQWYWIFIITIITFYIIQIFVGFIILSSIRKSNVKMCWIYVLYSIPFFGLFLFWIFGIIPLKIKDLKLVKKEKEQFNNYEDYSFSKKYFQNKNVDVDFLFAYNFDGSPLYKNNSLKIIDQKDLFQETLNIINKAKEFINIQYYVISESFYFNGIKQLLIKKAKENVKIRILYDYAGSYKRISKKSIEELKIHNIEVEVFNPKKINRFASILNFRSHKKLIIVDNKYCLTGGSNIGDEYLNLRKKYNNWIDLNYIIEGEIVNSINLNFCYDWCFYTISELKENECKKMYEKNKIHQCDSENIMQLINSGPDTEINAFSCLLISKIAKSKKSIIIATPYVLLQEQIVQQLLFASIRGVKIEFILPNMPDNKKYILAINRSNYKYFIKNNINVYEYLGFLHSKFILIDDDISILGSNNLDFRSIILNYESAFLIKSEKINCELKKLYYEYKKNSVKYDLNLVEKNYNYKLRIKMKFINIIHPLL